MLLRKGRQCFIGPVFTASEPPTCVIIVKRKYKGSPNDNFRKIICSEDDLRSRIFRSFF